MSKKKTIWTIILLAVAAGAFYGYKQYTRTNKDLAKVKADVTITADTLITEYSTNDSVANKKYLGKIVEVTGNVKKIEKDEKGYYTVVLGDTASLSSVRCSMDSVHQQDAARLAVGSSAILRGACTGFKKNELMGEDLGSDVELNRCAVIEKNK
jgi:tRNA_anti-like